MYRCSRTWSLWQELGSKSKHGCPCIKYYGTCFSHSDHNHQPIRSESVTPLLKFVECDNICVLSISSHRNFHSSAAIIGFMNLECFRFCFVLIFHSLFFPLLNFNGLVILNGILKLHFMFIVFKVCILSYILSKWSSYFHSFIFFNYINFHTKDFVYYTITCDSSGLFNLLQGLLSFRP